MDYMPAELRNVGLLRTAEHGGSRTVRKDFRSGNKRERSCGSLTHQRSDRSSILMREQFNSHGLLSTKEVLLRLVWLIDEIRRATEPHRCLLSYFHSECIILSVLEYRHGISNPVPLNAVIAMHVYSGKASLVFLPSASGAELTGNSATGTGTRPFHHRCHPARPGSSPRPCSRTARPTD